MCDQDELSKLEAFITKMTVMMREGGADESYFFVSVDTSGPEVFTDGGQLTLDDEAPLHAAAAILRHAIKSMEAAGCADCPVHGPMLGNARQAYALLLPPDDEIGQTQGRC